MDKSKMAFSPNVSTEAKKSFQEHLPVKISNPISKYSGIPTRFGDQRGMISDSSWKEFGRSLSVRKRKIFLLREEGCLSEQLLRQSQFMS